MPDELREMARARAQSLGLDTSEFHRQALAAWIAYHVALDLAGKKNAPRDFEAFAKAMLKTLEREP
jgi:hypothetical protein